MKYVREREREQHTTVIPSLDLEMGNGIKNE